MAAELEVAIKFLLDSGIEEDPFARAPARNDGLVFEIGENLVEVPGSQLFQKASIRETDPFFGLKYRPDPFCLSL